jgi:hypothetical protein
MLMTQPCYANPRELVEALRGRQEGAREQLAEWLGEPVARLLAEVVRRHDLPYDPEALTERALHGLETYLRARPPEEYAGMSPRAFRAAALVHLGRVLLTPFGRAGPGPGPAGPGPLPDGAGYEARTLFLPCERVGEHWFGGDWFGGARGGDGSLWVFLADVTGHGYYAYLLAGNLPGLWQACWEDLPADTRQPVDLLRALHDALEECLPEGVFVEACLARFDPAGQAVVASAGGTRLLLRDGARGEVALHVVRGPWLGLAPAGESEQQTWALGPEDELLLASDGFFDQLTPRGAAALGDGAGSLFEGAHAALQRALRERPQRDDISAVVLRRLPARPERSGLSRGDA